MRIIHIVLVCVFLLVAITDFVKASPPPGTTWKQDSSRSDEFNASSLDAGKWFSGPLWYSASGGWPFKPENGFVKDSNLNLRAVPGNPMTIAAVHSNFLVPGNSYLEVKAKCLPSAAHLLSAIWLQGPMSSSTNPNPEIDIQETFNFQGLTSHLHLWPMNPSSHFDGGDHYFGAGADVSADYHLYGLERRPEVLRFWLDGKLAWDAKPADQSFYSEGRWIIFSLEGHLGAPNTANLPAAFFIDYVRLYSVSTTAAAPSDTRKSRAAGIGIVCLQNGKISVAVPFFDYSLSIIRADGIVAFSVKNSGAKVCTFNRRTLKPGVYLLHIIAGRETISKTILIY